ncbi:MAG: hypothetical protein QUS35_03350 [bacterium]|nr:hypothetical protein [bacterium]
MKDGTDSTGPAGGNAGVGSSRIRFCDFHCPRAEFPKERAVDGSDSCRTFAAVWCLELQAYTTKNAPCAALFGKRRPKSNW